MKTLLAFLSLPLFALAQFDSAAVVGSIRDAQGGVMKDVAVTLENNATGLKLTTQTDANGDYVFPTVRIAAYRVSAAMTGFANAAADDVTLTVNARQRVDLTLRVGQVSETVNVVEVTPLFETDNSSKGQVIQAKQIVELPVLGRTYSSFALLSPGVRESSSGNQGSISTRREGSYNATGR